MNIKVLGCNGGASKGSGTTCIKVGEHILIDAGSGLTQLSLEAMRDIKHIFITHAHIDHICTLPTFLANLIGHTAQPVTVHALPATLLTLQQHIFNGQIWPDFKHVPSSDHPVMRYQAIKPWRSVSFDNYELTPFKVEHTVPTVGFAVQQGLEQFVFSADTKLSDSLIKQLDRLGPIETLMLECSFPDRYAVLAEQSGHLTPKKVHQLLKSLANEPSNVWITHLKPSYEAELRAVFAKTSAYQNWRVLK